MEVFCVFGRLYVTGSSAQRIQVMVAKKTKRADSVVVVDDRESLSLAVSAERTSWIAPLFIQDPGSVPIADAVESWSILDALGKAIDIRKEEYRQIFLKTAEASGTETDKGGFQLEVDGSEILNERRQDKQPDEDKLKILMDQKGLKYQECFDEVKSLQLNPSKFAYLVETGHFTEEEMLVLMPVSRAMKVKPNPVLKKNLSVMKSKLLGADQAAGTKRIGRR